MFSPDLPVRANDSITYLHCIKNRLSVMIEVMELFISYLDLPKFPSVSSCSVRTIFCASFRMINSKNVAVDILSSGLTVVISGSSALGIR